MKYNIFSKKLTSFVYEPIVHTDYVFSYITNYLYHLIKGLLMTVFILLLMFYQKIIIARLFFGWQRAFSFYKQFWIFLKNDSCFKWYSQTYSNDHHDQCWVCSSKFPYNRYCIRNHPSNTTSDHFFLSPKWKQNLSKTTITKDYPAKK